MSEKRPRKRRPEPERTEPIRNFSNTLRSEGYERPGPDDPLGDDFITSGVRQGYRLIDEQIRRGRQAASRMGARLGSSRSNLRDLTEGALRSYSDIYTEAALFWFDIATTGSLPMYGGSDEPAYEPDELDEPAPASPGAGFIPVEMSSARPARVHLHLPPGCEKLPLEALQLRARDVTKPPLMDVSFDTEEGRPVLRIRVPHDQPVDRYHGVVCHRDSGEPLGTLTVEIRQA